MVYVGLDESRHEKTDTNNEEDDKNHFV